MDLEGHRSVIAAVPTVGDPAFLTGVQLTIGAKAHVAFAWRDETVNSVVKLSIRQGGEVAGVTSLLILIDPAVLSLSKRTTI
jgi:hypothetical protein